MAKIRDYTITEFTTASATFTPDTMPVHETGDLLVAFWGKDSTTGLSTSTGWTEYIDQNSAAANGGIQMIRAASSSETFSATLTTETGVLVVMSIMDVFGSTLANALDLAPVVVGADDSTIPYSGVTGQSTTNNGCLLLYSFFSDGGTSPTAYPPAVNLYNGDATNGSLGVAYSWKETAGAIAEQQWYGRGNDEGRAMMFAVRSSGSGARSGYSDPAVSSGSVIRPLVGLSTMQSDVWPASLSLASIGGVTAVFDAAAVSGDNGTNAYTDGTSLAQVSSKTNIYAAQLNFGAAQDMDTGIILTAFRPSLVRDLFVDPAGPTVTGGGYQITLRDASNNYLSYTIHAKNANLISTPTGYVPVAVDWNGSATSWASSGTINKSAVASLLMGSRGHFGAVIVVMSMLCLVDRVGIAGGSASTPLNFNDLDVILNNCLGVYPLMVRSGSAATFFTPLQFGGADPIRIAVNLRTFQFPTRYNSSAGFFQWNAADNVAGVKFFGVGSGDSLAFTSCVFTSDSPYRWEFDASHSASAVLDFSGTSVVGATVTLRSTVTLTSVSFISCSEIVLNGADLASCTFQNQRTGANVGAVAFTSAGEGDGITSGTFASNNDGDLGHSIRITTTGTYTFDGHTFSGGGVAERNFNTFSGVNESTDVITTDAAHGYSHGDGVYYQDQGGTTLGGLTDGNLYYVRAVSTTTLAFYNTKANALADTSQIALTAAGSPGETHYIYSAKADVYNNSGGSVTINISNGGTTPTIRESNGSSTTVNNAVTLTVTVKNSAGTAIENAQVWVQKEADDADTGHPGNPFTLASGNNQGDADLVVNESPPSDLPGSGWIRVKNKRDEQTYRYASRSGTTFTFNTEVTGTDGGTGTTTVINETGIGSKVITEGDTIRNTTANPDQWATVLSVSANSVTTTPLSGGASWTSASYSVHRLAVNYKSGDTASVPLMNESTDASGIATESYNYVTDKDILVRIRLASGSPDYLPYSTAGTITSSGYTLLATLQNDTIKS